MQKKEVRQDDNRTRPGRLFVVGIGPGGPLDRTRRAVEAIAASDCVVGYTRYVELVSDLTAGKELIATGMTREKERCRLALARAQAGKTVALISSGDPGVYGMAGLVLELAASEGITVPIEIVPGVTAASALAARLGAPLVCDFAVVSLSDLLVPWEQIRRRLEAVAAADLVVAIYNPRSQKRTRQLAEAAAIFRRHRPGTTPVGIGTALGSPEEQILLSDLDHFLDAPHRDAERRDRREPLHEADWRVVCHAPGVRGMILLIGGTSETAPLAAGLAAAGYDVLVSTATDVPLAIEEHPRIHRRTGRLDEEGLVALAEEKGIRAIVDAAHPYAAAAHAAAQNAAKRLGIPCLVFRRPEDKPREAPSNSPPTTRRPRPSPSPTAAPS